MKVDDLSGSKNLYSPETMMASLLSEAPPPTWKVLKDRPSGKQVLGSEYLSDKEGRTIGTMTFVALQGTGYSYPSGQVPTLAVFALIPVHLRALSPEGELAQYVVVFETRIQLQKPGANKVEVAAQVSLFKQWIGTFSVDRTKAMTLLLDEYRGLRSLGEKPAGKLSAVPAPAPAPSVRIDSIGVKRNPGQEPCAINWTTVPEDPGKVYFEISVDNQVVVKAKSATYHEFAPTDSPCRKPGDHVVSVRAKATPDAAEAIQKSNDLTIKGEEVAPPISVATGLAGDGKGVLLLDLGPATKNVPPGTVFEIAFGDSKEWKPLIGAGLELPNGVRAFRSPEKLKVGVTKVSVRTTLKGKSSDKRAVNLTELK